MIENHVGINKHQSKSKTHNISIFFIEFFYSRFEIDIETIIFSKLLQTLNIFIAIFYFPIEIRKVLV